MKRLLLALILAVTMATSSAQEEPSRRRLPDGRDQTAAIVAAEHEKSLKEAEELVKLAETLRDEFKKHEGEILSLDAYRAAEEIEKLAKRIRSRMKRH